MLVTVKLRLTSPLLGETRPDKNGTRRFLMARHLVKVNISAWQEQFQMAATQLQYNVDARTIDPPEGIRPASIHLYKRTYSRVQTEWFESFRAGTVLTLDLLIHTDRKRAPDPIQLAAILRFVGERLGLSQFGSKFGYGRFEVISVEPTNSEKYERRIEPVIESPDR